MIDTSIEIASNFTIGDYHAERSQLSADSPNTGGWQRVIAAFKRRLTERFLQPITDLAKYDNEDPLPMRPGFAILALDCLLIDTIQSFREGRVTTSEVSPALSFKNFLRSSPCFTDFKSADRDDFFGYVRNALLHNGETREDWTVNIRYPKLLQKNPVTKTRTINRRIFHAGVLVEYRNLCREIEAGADTARENFLRRMDTICTWVPVKPRFTYFAYGSNLLLSEITQNVSMVEEIGLAYLPGYRLAFDKHSEKWGGDAANIHRDWSSIVWGYLYRIDDQGLERLKEREKGYDMLSDVTPLLVGKTIETVTPIPAIAFAAKDFCGDSCGPAPEYSDLLLKGLTDRGAQKSYVEHVKLVATPNTGRDP